MKATDHWVAMTLQVGAYLSFTLLLIAVAMGLAGLSAPALMIAKAGVIVLLVTPMLRIVAAMLMYISEHDRKMVFVSLTLLLVVITASVLGVVMH